MDPGWLSLPGQVHLRRSAHGRRIACCTDITLRTPLFHLHSSAYDIGLRFLSWATMVPSMWSTQLIVKAIIAACVAFLGMGETAHVCRHQPDISELRGALQALQALLNSNSAQLTSRNGVNGASAPLRIYVEFQNITWMPAIQQAKLVESVYIATKIASSFLSAKSPFSDNLLLQVLCLEANGAANMSACAPGNYLPVHWSKAGVPLCGKAGAQLNPQHFQAFSNCTADSTQPCVTVGGKGQATDFYLYMTVHDSQLCDEHNDQGAHGSTCMWYPSAYTFRPAAGFINVCPSHILPVGNDDLVELILHNLFHLLGFSGQYFYTWLDQQGNLQEGVYADVTWNSPGYDNNVVTTVPRGVLTQSLLDMYSQKFDCSSATSVPLEDEGGPGIEQEHWEFRMFQSDLMVAASPGGADGAVTRITPMTLAFMEATGWYTTNRSASNPTSWGSSAGCAFLYDCGQYMSENPGQNLFCSQPGTATVGQQYGCTRTMRSWAKCKVHPLSNRCPVWVSNNGWAGDSCGSLPNRVNALRLGASEGSAATCAQVGLPIQLTSAFMYSLTDDNSLPVSQSGLCYQSQCTNGTLQYFILGNWTACPTGTTLQLAQWRNGSFLQGNITCPNNDAVCQVLACPSGCYGRGDCNNGICTCRLMYSGADCSQRIAATPQNYTAPSPTSLYIDVAMNLQSSLTLFESQRYLLLQLLVGYLGLPQTYLYVSQVDVSSTATVAASADDPNGNLYSSLLNVGVRAIPLTEAEQLAAMNRTSSQYLTTSLQKALAAAGLNLIGTIYVAPGYPPPPPASPPPSPPNDSSNGRARPRTPCPQLVVLACAVATMVAGALSLTSGTRTFNRQGASTVVGQEPIRQHRLRDSAYLDAKFLAAAASVSWVAGQQEPQFLSASPGTTKTVFGLALE